MGKHEWMVILITLFLLVTGFLVSMVVGDDSEKEITLFVAFVALIYPIIKAIEASYDKNRVRKMKTVRGTSFDSLVINVNKELKNDLKGKTIISIDMVDDKKAVIIYF